MRLTYNVIMVMAAHPNELQRKSLMRTNIQQIMAYYLHERQTLSLVPRPGILLFGPGNEAHLTLYAKDTDIHMTTCICRTKKW